MHQFSASVILNCSAPSLRTFLGTPANLTKISHPELRLEILSSPAVVTIAEKIEFRVTSFGFKQRAVHVYTVASDEEIAEEQVEGPLRLWRHRQLIVSLQPQQTQLTDHIEYEPPGGMLGHLLTADRMHESLTEGFAARHAALQELIASGELV